MNNLSEDVLLVYRAYENIEIAPMLKDSPRAILGIYQRYYDQRRRCYNPNSKLYGTYGAIGIEVEYTSKEFVIWFLRNYRKFSEKYPNHRVSVGRIDHKKNYNFNNIEMQTVQENTSEVINRCGNPSPHGTKLTKILVIEIKDSRAKGASLLELANKYGVSVSTISHACTGRIWK